MYCEWLHQEGGFCGQALFLLDVVAHVTELLLQHTHSLKVSSVVEGISAEQQELLARRQKVGFIYTIKSPTFCYLQNTEARELWFTLIR